MQERLSIPVFPAATIRTDRTQPTGEFAATMRLQRLLRSHLVRMFEYVETYMVAVQ